MNDIVHHETVYIMCFSGRIGQEGLGSQKVGRLDKELDL